MNGGGGAPEPSFARAVRICFCGALADPDALVHPGTGPDLRERILEFGVDCLLLARKQREQRRVRRGRGRRVRGRVPIGAWLRKVWTADADDRVDCVVDRELSDRQRPRGMDRRGLRPRNREQLQHLLIPLDHLVWLD